MCILLAITLSTGLLTLTVQGLADDLDVMGTSISDTESEESDAGTTTELESDSESGDVVSEEDEVDVSSEDVSKVVTTAAASHLRAAAVVATDYKHLKKLLEEDKETVIELIPGQTYTAEGSYNNNTTYNARDHIGVTSAGTFTRDAAIDHDIIIYGNGATLNMGRCVFTLVGSHKLEIYDLEIKTKGVDMTIYSHPSYGVFQQRFGTTSSYQYHWTSKFTNIRYEGVCLLGNYNESLTISYENYMRWTSCELIVDMSRQYASDVIPLGRNELIPSGYSGHYGFILAENITIDGNLYMEHDRTVTSPTGVNAASMQTYFKSPGTTTYGDGRAYEQTSNIASGDFIVTAGSEVEIKKDSTVQGTDLASSYYHKSTIYGYKNFIFEEGSKFTGIASTSKNLTTGTFTSMYADFNYTRRSSVIRSNDCESFIIKKGAEVYLETLPACGTTASYRNDIGYTALSLAKQSHLNFEVAEGASLSVYSDAPDTVNSVVIPLHGSAPVMLKGKGSSDVTIAGTLFVQSQNGNAWAHQFYGMQNYNALATYSKIGDQKFTVTETGTVTLNGLNNGNYGAAEYAAFDYYGWYDTYITVEKGGVMDIDGRGYRGMSLAGSGNWETVARYSKKEIYVEGNFKVNGWSWGIAAEYMSDLKISAVNGGKIYIASNDNNASSDAAGAPSTIYSVGRARYECYGEGSQIYVLKNGGSFSGIFHDGFGPLEIDIDDGGDMVVNGRYSGTSTGSIRSRRAAIMAQSTWLSGTTGPYRSRDNYIHVNGVGSSLYVYSDNEYNHDGTSSDEFPMGAIAFNWYSALDHKVFTGTLGQEVRTVSAGEITISNGANFEAISASRNPTISLHNGTITFDNPGYFHIRNNATENTKTTFDVYEPGSGDIVGHAVYNHGGRDRNNVYNPSTASTTLGQGPSDNTAIEFKNCDVTVWSFYENKYNYIEEHIDNSWQNLSMKVDNKIGNYITTKDSSGNTVTGSGPGSLGTRTNYNGYTLKDNEFHLSSYGRINGGGSGYDLNFNKTDSKTGQALAGAEFAIWQYKQVYIDGKYDVENDVMLDGHYEDYVDSSGNKVKEYYYYDTATTSANWVEEGDVADDYSNITTITTTGTLNYNGALGNMKGLSYGFTYHLEEVTVPDGYTIHPNDEDTTFRIYTAEEIAAGVNKTQITIRNVPDEEDDVGSITINKVNDDLPLPNATFSIERYTGTGTPSNADLLDNTKWEKIEYSGGEWKTSSTGTTDITNASGQIIFENLSAGHYRITEVQAPSGYIPLHEPFLATVPYSSTTRLDDYDYVNKAWSEKDGTYYYYDIAYTVTDDAVIDLPASGSNWLPYMFVFIGTALILIAIGGYVRHRRKVKLE